VEGRHGRRKNAVRNNRGGIAELGLFKSFDVDASLSFRYRVVCCSPACMVHACHPFTLGSPPLGDNSSTSHKHEQSPGHNSMPMMVLLRPY
jgi:hypothetical protein